MRIALVYRSFHLEGSLARRTVEVARHLSRQHDVHVFSIGARTNASLAPNCTFHDVPVPHLGDGVRFSARELIPFALRAARLVDRTQFDVVHVCNPSTWNADIVHLPALMRGEAALAGRSFARFLASNVRHPANAARWAIEQRALRGCTVQKIHVDAPRVASDLQRYQGLAADRILVVPPGVNLEEFRPAADRAGARAAIEIGQDRIVLLFCGNDFARKGLDRAIDALAAASVDADLLVVGASSDDARFHELARAGGVYDRVRFLGRRSDPARFYAAADIVLLPTRADVWGVTPIEAMATGVPPILTRSAGSANVVEDAGAGVVLPEPFEIRELRDAIERLAGDPSLRNELGGRGIAAAPAHSWEARARIVEHELVLAAERRGKAARA